jgi:hypothetical protein
MRTRFLSSGCGFPRIYAGEGAFPRSIDGRVHTNGLENCWSLLKGGINGTYVSIEQFHLFRYLDEQSFRYNNRKDIGDQGRFEMAMRHVSASALHISN